MSETIWLKRPPNVMGLFPYDRDGLRDLQTLPVNKPLRGMISQPSNPEFKRRYWAIVSRLAAGIGKDKEHVDNVLKVAAGHCDVYLSERYGEIRIPRSIADLKCDDLTFRQYFDAAIPLIPQAFDISLKEFDDLLKDRRKWDRES